MSMDKLSAYEVANVGISTSSDVGCCQARS
jgi:hypothetical protein